jgi:hypothetical protein
MFPIIPANSATAASGNDEGIFRGGYITLNMTNLVSNAGVVASDVAGVGTGRYDQGGTQYGGDKGIFGFGNNNGSNTGVQSMTNLVSNTGVVSSDVAGVGTARNSCGACEYGTDTAIFAFGSPLGSGALTNVSNLVSNTGVVASDQAATTGTVRSYLAACEYGGDKGIVGFGSGGGYWSITNLVSNAGVVASDTAGVGTARSALSACSYGGDKGIFGFGYSSGPTWHSTTNLVSNTGVVSSDVAGVGTGRYYPSACEYGQDKGIFGFGYTSSATNVTNLVSNTGVVASNQAATTGTARNNSSACSFN